MKLECIKKSPVETQALSRGFTLIELLVVIAILGILAAILIPVIGKVRESAHQTECVSNLRQIGVATALYQTENKGLFPSLNAGSIDDGVQLTWVEQLRPYLKTKIERANNEDIVDVVHCPSAKYHKENGAEVRTTTRAYGWNPYLVPDTRIMNGAPISNAYRAVKVQRPSEVILMADGLQRDPSGWANYFVFDFGQVYRRASADEILPAASFGSEANPTFRTRHNGLGNALFVDGHVESFGWLEIKEKHVRIEQLD